MEKINLITCALLALMLFACDQSPVLDGSSQEAYNASLEAVKEGMSDSEIKEFEDALRVVAFSNVNLVDMFSENGGDKALAETMKTIDGLSASNVIAKAQTLKDEAGESEKLSEEKRAEPVEESAAWNVVDVVDEFGDIIPGESGIVGLIEGRMSNSATTSGDVSVKIQVGEENKSYITFYEYGDIPGNLPNEKFFNIKIKTENGDIEEIEQFSFKDMLTDSKGALISKALLQSTPLKVVVDLSKASEYESTVYNFEIDGAELKALLDKSN